MLVTVAICTLNRAESLRRTLDSLVAMHLLTGLAWEVLVVNNNCTDHTDDVIKDFTDRLPVRRLFEPQQGQSRARNCAIDAAKGDYIVWTDDDVVVDPGWLIAYVDAFRRWPNAAVFGGRSIPRYETPVAKWIPECEALLDTPYAIRDLGADALPITSPDVFPVGANFAVRALEQRRFPYNPQLGYAPGRRYAYDEVDVLQRLIKSGATGYWIPTSRIDHCISHERQTLRYISKSWYGLGEGSASLNPGNIENVRFLFGAPRWLWRQLIVLGIRFLIGRLFLPTAVWMADLRAYSVQWGIICYWRNRRRGAN